MKNEKGFVLVTTLILIAILTLMGTASAYQTVVGMKVSRLSQDMNKSMSSADTGLSQIYWYWTQTVAGKAEFTSLISYIGSGLNKPAIYQGTITPSFTSQAPTDAEIQANPGIKVFTLSSGGAVLEASAAAWATSSDPQVAVWATSFNNKKLPKFPYSDPRNLDTEVCSSGCRMVVYALGRSGKARNLVRETNTVVESSLLGMGAIVNAVQGDDFTEICNPGSGNKTGTANGSPFDYTMDSFGGLGNMVVEASQADYKIGTTPSGTAFISNNKIGLGSKGFSAGLSSQTAVTFRSIPYVLYSGHDTESGFKISWADDDQDTVGTNLPSGQAPKGLVADGLFATGNEVKVFKDNNSQIFDMDTYRWGAEQFTCQDPTKANNFDGNGLYCSKGEALRQAMVSKGYPAYAPITGRLTIAEFQYNIANSIPMFGLVRVLVPVTPDLPAASTTCEGLTTVLHQVERPSQTSGNWDLTRIRAGGVYTGTMPNPATKGGKYSFRPADGATPDADGKLGPNARLMIYGSLIFDYFSDYDLVGGGLPAAGAGDTVFSPFSGERLLKPLEAPDAMVQIHVNTMINPVMPRFVGNSPLAFPTGAPSMGLSSAGSINMVDQNSGSSNMINLASPYDGYFPWSEGMLPVIGESAAGTMRLMSRVGDNPSDLGLVKMVSQIGVDSVVTGTNFDMGSILAMPKPTRPGQTSGVEGDIIQYYYDLRYTNTDKSKSNDWPMAPFPGNDLSGVYCAGVDDCKPDIAGWQNNMGDKVNLMFPSGYIHGWKVALAALDVKAIEWNYLLSVSSSLSAVGIGDTGGLYEQIANICSSDPITPGTSCLMGAPFSIGVDEGALSLAVVKDKMRNETKFFYVKPDPVSGYGIINSDWQDIPVMMYSGGLLEMQAHSNISGAVYTPGPLEWEAGNASYDGGSHMAYLNGTIITGYGNYIKNTNASDRYVLVYDSQAADNVNTNKTVVVLRRYDWQSLN